MMKTLVVAILLSTTAILSHASAWFAVTGRSTPFTPNSISNLVAWYDPSDTGTVTSAGGLLVSMLDKSSSHNNVGLATSPLTDSTAPAYPGTTINGLNTLGFTQATKQCAKMGSSIAPTYTIVFVLRPTAVLGINNVVLGGGGTGKDVFDIYAPANIIEITDGPAYVDVNDTAAANVTNVFAIKSDSTIAGTTFYKANSLLSVNGSSGTTLNSTKIALQYLGCAQASSVGQYWASALLGELTVYSRILTSQEMLDLYAYEKAKWGTL